jgi:phospholipid transport system substrate-binding protein
MCKQHPIYGLAILLFMSLAVPCYAAETGGAPSAFVADIAHKAFLSATGKTLSSLDRQRQFEELLDEDFDVPRIASFVLGRYWQKTSDTERQTFIAVFRDFMVSAYSQRFPDYNGQSLRVIGERTESATSTMVYTEIDQPASGQPIKVEWRVADRGGYRIVDINISGISMALAQREEFASSLQRNGGDISGLVQQLKSKMSAHE